MKVDRGTQRLMVGIFSSAFVILAMITFVVISPELGIHIPLL